MDILQPRKRAFYFVMGSMCLFISVAILCRVGAEFWQNGRTFYGRHIPYQHVALQWLHIVLGTCFWSAVAGLGALWLWRAVAGEEPAAANVSQTPRDLF